MNNRQRHSIIALLCCMWVAISIHGVFAQDTLRGRIIDAQYYQPVAFAIVEDLQTGKSTLSDIDGRFCIAYQSSGDSLLVRRVGFASVRGTVAELHQTTNCVVELQADSTAAMFAAVAENTSQCLWLVDSLIRHKAQNNPRKEKAYQFRSYNKTLFSTDGLTGNYVNPINIQFLQGKNKRRPLSFISEMVSTNSYKHHDLYSYINAAYVSGFRDPWLGILINENQKEWLYNNKYRLLDQTFTSPFSEKAAKYYSYRLIDSLCNEAGKRIYVLQFCPKANAGILGMKGVAFVETDDFAICNIVMESAEENEFTWIKYQQQFVKAHGRWFAEVMQTEFRFNQFNLDGLNVFGTSTTYNFDFLTDKKKVRVGEYALEYVPTTAEKREALLDSLRRMPLLHRERMAREHMDTLGNYFNFDSKVSFLKALLSLKIRFRYLDWNLPKVVDFTIPEGLRLTMKFNTNENLSKHFMLEGYGGYGMLDKEWKYGGAFVVNAYKRKDINVYANYYNDLVEAGGIQMLSRSSVYTNVDFFRNFWVECFDKVESYSVGVNGRLFNYLTTTIDFSRQNRNPMFAYAHKDASGKLTGAFTNTTLSVACRFAYRERFFRDDNFVFSQGTVYPIINLQLTHGFEGIAGGDYAYNRIDVAAYKTLHHPKWGTTDICIRGGIIDNDIPYSLLYAAAGDFNSVLFFYGKTTFSTMRYNEFLSSGYIAAFISHNVGRLYSLKLSKPELVLHQNMGFGWLQYPHSHIGMENGTYDKGYYECGVSLLNLIDLGFIGGGVGLYCKYGPYYTSPFRNNINFKFSVSLPF